MFPAASRLIAAAAALCLAPLGTAALAQQGQSAAGETPNAPANAAAPATPATAAAEASDDKRVCRYVKLDMSSRRKTKVCRTVAEWREINNPR